MAPLIHPRLVNGVFDDPGVYAEFMYERRALMFDLGDNQALAARSLLNVTDAFVSHAHLDHFSGFDRLLRLCLGRQKTIRLFGPEGFIDRVRHKLGAYTWNLVGNYEAELAFEVTELRGDGTRVAARFSSRDAFGRRDLAPPSPAPDTLFEDAQVRVSAAVLDHRTPCLAFALRETAHVNVWKNRVEALGLGVGPWLRELKQAVLAGVADDTPIRAVWHENGERRERGLPLGQLKAEVLSVSPGFKIGYVVDVVYNDRNAERIVKLVHDADVLFIETPFLHEDAAQAARKYHLTARQAGTLAREAHVKSVVPFHFSPRYLEREAELRRECEAAFAGAAPN